MGNFPGFNSPEPCERCGTTQRRRIYSLPLQALLCEDCEEWVILSVIDELAPQIVICRDVPGDHVGGPACWCDPYIVDPTDEIAVRRALDLARHPERQVT